MDRFVWFVLLVVISHLATEFTRVTGYSRGPRQDVVMVNDSLIQPIKVQNQLMYPGQEYGPYEQPNQQHYNANNHYNNYVNNENSKTSSHNVNNNNFLSRFFKQFSKGTPNNPNEEEQIHMSHMPNSVNSNNLLNLAPSNNKLFSWRPLIDSIFEIPISTLRAVNELLGRFTGGYNKPQPEKQQQPQQPEQNHLPATTFAYYPYATSNLYYGLYRTAAGAMQPKTQYEMLNKTKPQASSTSTTPTSRKSFLPVGPQS